MGMACVWSVDVVRRREIALPVTRLEKNSAWLWFCSNPWSLFTRPPVSQGGTRQIATGRANGELLWTQEQAPTVSHSEMTEPFNCADGIAATAQTWVNERLGHFADMH
jgi:hypothetical protein